MLTFEQLLFAFCVCVRVYAMNIETLLFLEVCSGGSAACTPASFCKDENEIQKKKKRSIKREGEHKEGEEKKKREIR